MTDAFVIETTHHTAGIAVRERRGFRFYASDLLFQPIDNRKFRDLHGLRVVVDRFAAASRSPADARTKPVVPEAVP
jgi:hypothetical protein